jgi:hypothetical protein
MRGKGRGLEVHTLAYPCTLTKGSGVCQGYAYVRISFDFFSYKASYSRFHQLNSDFGIVQHDNGSHMLIREINM